MALAHSRLLGWEPAWAWAEGTWVSASLSSFGGPVQGVSMFLWQNSAQCTVSRVSVEHVPSKTGPAFLPSPLCVTGYTEKKKTDFG